MQALLQPRTKSINGPGRMPFPNGHAQRACLRGSVLKLGGLLGLEPAEVKTLAGGLTGAAWQVCGPAQLEAVIDEYRSIAEVLLAKQRRRLRRQAAAAHGRGMHAS